ncbi:MAG TPA: hypothetical protein VGR28_02085 [Candidatus Thermoplasmatota archaeon]|nr:hypothetical protein [Candidatus Thermoplasmatota archaeon]
MRTLVATLIALAMTIPAASFAAPLEADAPSLDSGDFGVAMDPEVQHAMEAILALSALTPGELEGTPFFQLDWPFLVDEDGDEMTGDLEFGGSLGVQFPGGRLTANPSLTFGANQVCLAGVIINGCSGGDITGVNAGTCLTGGGLSGDVTLNLNAACAQLRVSGSCPAGQSIRVINQDGTVSCEQDDDTTYLAGTGLNLVGTTFSVNTAAIQSRVAGTCAAGSSVRVINSDGSVTCETDDDTTYSAGSGLTLTGTQFSVNTASVQSRVSGSCPVGQYVRVINSDGTVTCGTDADTNSGGTVTSITAGSGLTGGTITSSGTLAVDTATIQSRVSGSCAAGNSIRAIASDGTVTCEPDDDTNSGGTVTSVGSGAGLTGGPITGSGSLSIATGGVTSAMILDGAVGAADVNTVEVQKRVSGSCPAGQSIRVIASDGTVTCEADDTGSVTAGQGISVVGNEVSLFNCGPEEIPKGDGSGDWACFPDADTTYTAGAGLQLSLTTFSVANNGITSNMISDGSVSSNDIDQMTVQRRVTGNCATGSSIRVINQDGTVTCQSFVTSITAGPGLTCTGCVGGVITSAGTLLLAAPTAVTMGGVLSATCGYGMVLTGVDTSGNPLCTADSSWRLATVPRTNTFTTAEATNAVGSTPSVTIGADGFPVIAHRDETNGDLRVTKCANIKCTSSSSTSPDTANQVGVRPSIAIAADGFPIIAERDATSFDLRVVKCGNAACTSGNTVTAVDTGGDVGNYPSLGIGTDGLAVISYYDATNGDLKVLKCGNASCNAGNAITTVDNAANNVGLYSSLTIRRNGLPIVAYHDETNGDLKVVACGNAACSAGNTINTPDASANDVGEYASIALSDDLFPVISYFDATASDLKVMKCSVPACATNNIVIVDGTNAGSWSSLVIGTDGNPVISYDDIGNTDLKIAKCTAVDCSGTPYVASFASGNNEGAGTSLAMGADGLPFVAYADSTNIDLRVAHLANEYGASNWWRRG